MKITRCMVLEFPHRISSNKFIPGGQHKFVELLAKTLIGESNRIIATELGLEYTCSLFKFANCVDDSRFGLGLEKYTCRFLALFTPYCFSNTAFPKGDDWSSTCLRAETAKFITFYCS